MTMSCRCSTNRGSWSSDRRNAYPHSSPWLASETATTSCERKASTMALTGSTGTAGGTDGCCPASMVSATRHAGAFVVMGSLRSLRVFGAAGEHLLTQRRRAHQSAHPHRLDGAARHEHERALLLQALVEHVHRTQMERRRVFVIRLRGLGERGGDFPFGLAENDPRLLLPR